MARLWLDPIPEILRGDAVAALDERNVLGFLCTASNEVHLDLVWNNAQELKTRGLYEAALLDAFDATRTNNARWPMEKLCRLFRDADRGRLHELSPLPGPGPFTIFRGVGGRGVARRVRGLSWSGSQETARRFADRASQASLHDPAVYETTVEVDHVVAYLNERGEDEYVVLLPSSIRPRRVA